MTTEKFEGTAPGRLDVMGGIADYSGSLVIQKPIREKTAVKFGFRNDGLIIARTFSNEEEETVFIIEYQALLVKGKVDFEFAQNLFKATNGGSWASYIVGCLLVLQKEKGIKVPGGEFEVRSKIPEGKGVSSSAALEIATMKAIAKAYNLQFTGTEMAKLAQVVENQIVGAPCGLMDQLACSYGKFGTLLPIICQPDNMLKAIELPANVHFIGIDSGTRHHVGGASYADVRKATFMGYSIVAESTGCQTEQLLKSKRSLDKSEIPYRGFLANVNLKDWEEKYIVLLPDEMYGHEFIPKYKDTIDTATKLKLDKKYFVKNCASHPVYENFRNQQFYHLLLSLETAKNKNEIYEKLGELMYRSHDGYSKVLLGSKPTDRLVEMVKDRQGQGVFGAKITGGGSGGTVCILAVGDLGLQTAQNIHKEYQLEIGKTVKFFT